MSIFTKTPKEMINLQDYSTKTTGPIIFFLHGNSLNHHIFKNQYNSELGSLFRMAGIDLPGHGNSPKWKRYSLEKMAEEVCCYMESFSTKPYYIIAHSLSGHVVIQGLKYLKNVKGIILNGTPPLSSPMDATDAFQPELTQLLFQSSWKEHEMELIITALSQNEKQTIDKGLSQCDPSFKNCLVMPDFLTNYKNEWVELKKKNIPVVLSFAKNDMFINLAYLKDAFRKHASPNISLFEFQDGGHLPFLNNSIEFNHLINNSFTNS